MLVKNGNQPKPQVFDNTLKEEVKMTDITQSGQSSESKTPDALARLMKLRGDKKNKFGMGS